MNHGADNPVSVLLVDDHAVVREGYSRLLERQGDIVVIGEAADAATAHALFCSLDPQIVVMDISMPGTSGIEADSGWEKISQPGDRPESPAGGFRHRQGSAWRLVRARVRGAAAADAGPIARKWVQQCHKAGIPRY